MFDTNYIKYDILSEYHILYII